VNSVSGLDLDFGYGLALDLVSTTGNAKYDSGSCAEFLF
jgi:hypothetical protein